MPKIKIKDWKGIYTNIDENDANLQVVRESINFRHNRGFLQFEPYALTLDSVPTLTGGYEWETGIYCTLSNDPLAEVPVPATYNILFLVAKVWDVGTSTWNRKMYFRLNNVWEEIDSTYTDLVSADFNTGIDGKTFFKVDGGRLKIYMPHTAFWFGRLTRNFYGDHQWGTSYSLDGFRLEKLIDGLSVTNQDVNVSVGFSPVTDVLIYLNERPVLAHYVSTGTMGSNYIATGTKHFFEVYTFRYADTNEIIPNPIQLDANNYHYFPAFTDDGGFTTFWIQEEYNALFKIGGDTLDTLYGPPTNYDLTGLYDSPYANGWDSSATMNYYNVPRILGSASPFFDYKTQNEDCTWLENGSTTATEGFEITVTKIWIIITAVWDEREETIVTFTPFEWAPTDKWALQLTALEPVSATGKRLTRLRVYAKVDDGVMADFELVRDVEYINPDALDNSIIYIYPDVFTGITLNDNIGFLVDEKKISEYQIKEGFRSIVSINDISFGVASADYSSVYYSVVGGGNLMPDLLYSQNIYPLNNVATINAMANINGRIGLFTDNTLYIIDIVDDAGVLLFTIKSTLEFGVKNNNDVAEIQGGVAIHTMHGIYTTTGTQSNLISEPIDNIVKANFLTGSITFNKYKHELLYKSSIAEDLYRFRFKDQVWEKLDKDYGT